MLRDVRLGYLAGYEEALLCGEQAEEQAEAAAEARWGDHWRKKIRAARERSRFAAGVESSGWRLVLSPTPYSLE